MKFKYKVVANNTMENRNWLVGLGYNPLESFLNKKYIYTNVSNRANYKEKWKEYYFETHDDIKLSPDKIYCIGNDKLFRAISALRDDSDYMQWFISPMYPCGIDWFLCRFNDRPKLEEYTELKKASLEELIEHFKKVNYESE